MSLVGSASVEQGDEYVQMIEQPYKAELILQNLLSNLSAERREASSAREAQARAEGEAQAAAAERFHQVQAALESARQDASLSAKALAQAGASAESQAKAEAVAQASAETRLQVVEAKAEAERQEASGA